MFVPDLLDVIPNCCSMWDIRILEVLPQHHKNLTQLRALNDIERLEFKHQFDSEMTGGKNT